MRKPVPRSLRRTLTAAVFALAGLGAIDSAALIALTTYLHRTSVTMGSAVESVRLSKRAQILLLLHERTQDPVVARHLESQLRREVGLAHTYVTTDQEARTLVHAEAELERYLASSRRADLPKEEIAQRQEAAYAALASLVDENVVQAISATEDAERWDAMGNRLGVATAVLPLLLAGWLLWWVNARALRPLFALARTMSELGSGDRAVRAEETGPSEVRAMAARFNEMAAALAAQRETQMAFLAGVAHDLRNPLSALSMSMAVFRPDKPLPPEARIRRSVEVVERQLARMDRMLGDFLDMAKIEAGQLDVVPETVDARRLVREAVDLFETTSPLHEITSALPDDPVPVRCDPLRMAQVLTNLIGNAIKYSPRGGPVLVTLARDGEDAVFEVKDSGVGMSPEEQPLLFEPFRRIGPTKDRVAGLGLGLFVVKRIVEAHGGSIHVESALGRGSTFRVRVALAPSESA